MCGGQAEDPRELWFPSNLSAGRRRPVSQRQGRQAQRHPSYSLSEQFRPQWIGRGPAHTGGPPALLSWQFECASHPETPSQTHPGCLARWAPSQVIHRPPPQSGALYKWEGAKGPPLHPPSLQTVPPTLQPGHRAVWFGASPSSSPSGMHPLPSKPLCRQSPTRGAGCLPWPRTSCVR